jgi:ribosomal protein S14
MQNKCQNFNIKKMINKEYYKNLTKFFIANKCYKLKSNKIIKIAYRYFYFYKFSSISYFRRSCVKSTKCNSVFKFFKMSRYLCRLYASNGFFVGIIKASF